MRFILVTTTLLVALAPASAQTFTPLSGPNTPVPSPICDIINFGFCPQPAPPPPPGLPDPNAEASRVARPLPPAPPRPSRSHRHHRRIG